MFNLGFPELMLILVIALVVFGPRKLPEIGKAIGKAVGEFKHATEDISKEFREAAEPAREIKEAIQESVGEVKQSVLPVPVKDADDSGNGKEETSTEPDKS